jgi:eukaryotic-like serine/threonine-protein kinase
MHALLEALAPPRRRGGALLAAGGAVVIAALAAVLMLRGGEAGDPCATTNDRFAGVWDPAVRAEVERAFTATKIPYATVAFNEVARQLDRHRVAWEAMRRDSCEATRVRKEQSDAALDLRAACLDGRFDAIAAFVGVLRRADADTIKGFAQRAASVGDVTDCADVAALQRRVPVPSDKREAALALTPDLAAARAEVEAGHTDGTLARAETLLERAKTLDYAPLLAEAYQIAALADEEANQPEAAERRLAEAVKAADAGGDDTRRYDIEIELTRLVGYVLERDADGLEHVARARALARRLGANPRREAQLARLVGIHHWTFGRYADAIRETQRAIELYERIDPEGGDHARALHNMAIIHDDMNDAVHGLPYEERAIAIASRIFGADHPSYQNMLSTKANLLRRLDRLDEAEAIYRAHLDHVLRVHGPDASQVGGARMNLGGLLRDKGQLDDAIVEFRAAVAQYERTSGPDHSWTANALDNLGGSLSKTDDPKLHAEAEQVLRRAVDIYTKRLGPTAPPTATATRHLAEHLARQGRHADTIPLYEGAIAAVEQSQGKDSALLARPLLGLGEAHLALKHHAAARAALDRALKVVDDDPDDLQIKERIVAALAKLPR